MSLPWGKIAVGGLIAVGSFGGAVWAMNAFRPAGTTDRKPALVAVPPLPAAARTSTVVTPVVIALTAIRDSLERTAPRDLTGKRDNPLSQLLSNGEISWS